MMEAANLSRHYRDVRKRLEMPVTVSDMRAEIARLREENERLRDPLGSMPTPLRILDAVCKHYRVDQTDLLSWRRTKNILWPRFVAYYLAETITLQGTPAIGRDFNRDQSAIRFGTRKVRKAMLTDPKLARDVATITEALHG